MTSAAQTPNAQPQPPSKLQEQWSKAFGLLQKMGKSLMLPVSVLPVAGMLLGLGSARLIEIQKLEEGVLESAKFDFLPASLAEIMKARGMPFLPICP